MSDIIKEQLINNEGAIFNYTLNTPKHGILTRTGVLIGVYDNYVMFSNIEGSGVWSVVYDYMINVRLAETPF